MTHSNHPVTRLLRDDSGVALLIAVIVLLLMSALGLAALQRSGDEASSSGRSRRKDATLYAAESGMAVAKSRVIEARRTQGPEFQIVIDEPSVVEDASGQPIHVRSGIPSGGTLPATAFTIKVTDEGTDRTQGMSAKENEYKGGNVPLRVDISAMDAGGGLVHLIGQYTMFEMRN